MLGSSALGGTDALAKSTVSGDHTTIAALEAKIAAQGSEAQTIVAKYNSVANQLAVINARIATERKRLARDRAQTSQASTYLRQVAIAAYVNAQFGNSSKISSFTGTKSASTVQEKNVYLGTVNGTLETATASLENDREDVSATEHVLAAAQAQTTAQLKLVAASRAQAERAVAASEATLHHVKGNLLALVTAAAAKRAEAREEAAEAAIAAATTQRSSESASAGADVTATPSAGSYENPLRSINGLGPERVDQGVDYRGFGPIFAIGDGVVVSTYNSGWPGGTFITYRLTDGPAAGLTVYAAEDIEPTVFIGQHVTPSTKLGEVYEGSTGIELGWADPAGNGTTMAADNNEYYGSNSTAFGVNFSELLQSLGSPGGQVQNSPTGSVPASWPRW